MAAQPQPYFERPAFNTDANERPVERPERQDRNFDRGANPNGERQDRQPRNDRRFGQQGERAGGDRPQGQGQGDKVATAFAISNRVSTPARAVRNSRAWISSP